MIRVVPRPHRPVWHAWTAAIGFAVAAAFSVPLAIEANGLLRSDDDPVAITDRALSRAFDRSAAVGEIADEAGRERGAEHGVSNGIAGTIH